MFRNSVLCVSVVCNERSREHRLSEQTPKHFIGAQNRESYHAIWGNIITQMNHQLLVYVHMLKIYLNDNFYMV